MSVSKYSALSATDEFLLCLTLALFSQLWVGSLSRLFDSALWLGFLIDLRESTHVYECESKL